MPLKSIKLNKNHQILMDAVSNGYIFLFKFTVLLNILFLNISGVIRDIHDVLLLYLWGLMNDKPLIAPSVLHLLTDMDSWPGLSLTQLRMIR